MVNKVKDDNQNEAISDNWRLIVAGILFAKAAVATFSISPFLIGGYIDSLGFSAQQAGQVLSVEIFSLAISNALAFFWIGRVSYRVCAQYLLLLLFALNIFCAFTSDFNALVLQRCFIGLTEGALLALGFGLLSNTLRPNRNFGFYFAVSLLVGAINVQILPLFVGNFGSAGLFINLSLYAVIAFTGLLWANRSGALSVDAVNDETIDSELGASELDSMAEKVSSQLKIAFPLVPLIFLLLANYVYFVGQGSVWSFLERLGLQWELDLVTVANALSLSLVAGVMGGATAGWLDLKFGRVLPLLAAIGLAIVSISILWAEPGWGAFTVAVCLFNYGNNLGHAYILGFAANIDKSARLTVLSGALHTGGQATGPLIAGVIVAEPDFTPVLFLGFVAFLATIALFVLAAALGYKNNMPSCQDRV